MSNKNYPFNLLDDCHLPIDENQRYEVFEIDAKKLLSYKRFDLYAILLYIDHKVKGLDMSFATELYQKRTQAMTGYTFKEVGNDLKNSFEKYIESLDKLIEVFKKELFDPDISIVPVDQNNILIDGAHRVSCAAYFNKKITVIKFIDWDIKLDVTSNLLRDKFVLESYTDTMALEYCKWHKNIYMLIFWPKSFNSIEKKNEADLLINDNCNVVYRKKIKLNYTAIRNLMLQIYGHMDWVGSIDDKFQNTYAKATEVYDSNQWVECVLLEAESFQTIYDLKQQIRGIFNIGLASVHTTDNWSETNQVANLLFNPNSIHHLETSEPDKFKNSYQLVEEYKSIIKSIGHNCDDYILDASIVMSLYGIREANDLDYLTTSQDKDKVASSVKTLGTIDNHHDFFKYHTKKLNDLLYNPSNYFVFNEMKFITLENLSAYKIQRGEKKDLVDVKLIKMYQNKNNRSLKFYMLTIKNDFKRKKSIYRIAFILNLMYVLKKTHLYTPLKKFYHLVKKIKKK